MCVMLLYIIESNVHAQFVRSKDVARRTTCYVTVRGVGRRRLRGSEGAIGDVLPLIKRNRLMVHLSK